MLQFFMTFASGFLGGILFFIGSLIPYLLLTKPAQYFPPLLLGEERVVHSNVFHFYCRVALLFWILILLLSPCMLIFVLKIPLYLITVPGLIGLYLGEISLFILWLSR